MNRCILYHARNTSKYIVFGLCIFLPSISYSDKRPSFAHTYSAFSGKEIIVSITPGKPNAATELIHISSTGKCLLIVKRINTFDKIVLFKKQEIKCSFVGEIWEEIKGLGLLNFVVNKTKKKAYDYGERQVFLKWESFIEGITEQKKETRHYQWVSTISDEDKMISLFQRLYLLVKKSTHNIELFYFPE